MDLRGAELGVVEKEGGLCSTIPLLASETQRKGGLSVLRFLFKVDGSGLRRFGRVGGGGDGEGSDLSTEEQSWISILYIVSENDQQTRS